MATKHTPGPWVHYDDSRDGKTNRHEIAAMGKTVCHIYHSVPEQDAANARLIAAAPELLAALVALVERGTDSPEHLAAEASIAKATGEQAEFGDVSLTAEQARTVVDWHRPQH